LGSEGQLQRETSFAGRWQPWVAWVYGASFDRRTEQHVPEAGLELLEAKFVADELIKLITARVPAPMPGSAQGSGRAGDRTWAAFRVSSARGQPLQLFAGLRRYRADCIRFKRVIAGLDPAISADPRVNPSVRIPGAAPLEPFAPTPAGDDGG
jgi:hypothetical protein